MDTNCYEKVPTEDDDVSHKDENQCNEIKELKIQIDPSSQCNQFKSSPSSNSDNASIRLYLDPNILTPSREGLNTASTVTSHTHVCNWNRSERRQARLNTKLLHSVVNGCYESVIQVLQTGANPNAKCRQSHVSALHIAVLMGFTNITRELLRRRADCEATDKCGRNPVHFAAYYGHTDCLMLLLENSINFIEIDDSSSQHKNVLINTRCIQQEEITNLPRYMTDSWDHDCTKLENLIPSFESGSTPLHIACQNCHTDFIAELLKAGADTTLEDSRRYLPLNTIGENLVTRRNANEENIDLSCFLESIKLMFNHNAGYKESCTEPTFYPTPLHTATVLDHVEAIRFILTKNTNLESFDLEGHTPIHISVWHESYETLRPLLDAFAERRITIDLRNRYGLSPLQLAIEKQWATGISALLEAGADIQVTSLDGDTALHKAASTRNANLLEDILEIQTARSIINVRNKNGETPLFCAIANGCLKCVQFLLNFDARVTVELPNQITVLHRAAEYGHTNILSALLDAIKKKDRVSMINKRDTIPMSGMTALHMAAYGNKLECVRVLLEAGADSNMETTASPHDSAIPLHLAASAGHASVVGLLLEHDSAAITKCNGLKCNALHLAAQAGQRECIKVLLKHNGDLSAPLWNEKRNCTETTIQIILNNVSRPTEFLEEIFDSCITTNDCLECDPNCTIEIKYDILTACEGPQEMRVLKALMNTGNRFGQKRIVLHPVIESFLYLKWQALYPLFYFTLFLYFIFVISVTLSASSFYYYKRTDPGRNLLQQIGLHLLRISLCVIIPQEILHAYQNVKKYIMDLETWVKWSSFILSLIVTFVDHNEKHSYDWPRHVTAIAVLLVWLELMFLFSRFPDWGYYVLMFFKVTTNVVKVLLTFAFLVIGFSYSFLIEFQADAPFRNPWEAIMKTIVMMTSEFDYSDLFNSPTENESWASSNIIGRVVFIVFVILASIVLMNLMIGLAVSDINNLEIQGKIRRLEKHIDFLVALDGIVVNRFIMKYQKSHCLISNNDNLHIKNGLTLYPGKSSSSRRLPTLLKEHIFDKAAEKNEMKNIYTLKTVTKDIEEIKKIINDSSERSPNPRNDQDRDALREKRYARHSETVTMLNEVTAKINALEERMQSSRPRILENSERLENIEKYVLSLQSSIAMLLDKLNLS